MSDKIQVEAIEEGFIFSQSTGEPSGSTIIKNIVKIKQSEFDAGELVPETFYIISDAPTQVVLAAQIRDLTARLAALENPTDTTAPVIVDVAITLNENGSIVFDLLENATDTGGSGVNPFGVEITTQPNHGTVIQDIGGMFTYAHDGSETVSDFFDYTVTDYANNVSNIKRCSITVVPVDDTAPILGNDTASLTEGGSVIINLVSNDSDAESGLDLNSIVLSTASHGVLVDNSNGTVTYTHDDSGIGNDSFIYSIADNDGNRSENGTVSITILEAIEHSIDGNEVTLTNPNGAAGTWNFGDGNTSTELNPVYVYAVHGTYNIFFDSDTGVDDSNLEVVVTALPLPTASFTSTPDDPESNIVTFHGIGGDTYSWIIDGVQYTGQNPTHTFSAIADDTYTVDLVVTDSNGNTGFVTEQVFVQIDNVPPVVNLSYNKNLLVVDFDSNAVDPDGADYIMTCEWDFGDGNTLSTGVGVTSAQHTYPAPTVPLDPNGQEFTTTVSVTDERGGVTTSAVTFKIFDYLALGAELLPTNLATMDSDDVGLVSKFGANTIIDFDTYPSEMYYEADPSLGSSRHMVDVSAIGLEVGKRYVYTSRIKAIAGAGQLRDWTCASIPDVNLIVDGVYHEYTFAFQCTDATGETRISHNNILYIDTMSIKEEL